MSLIFQDESGQWQISGPRKGKPDGSYDEFGFFHPSQQYSGFDSSYSTPAETATPPTNTDTTQSNATDPITPSLPTYYQPVTARYSTQQASYENYNPFTNLTSGLTDYITQSGWESPF